MVGAYGRTAKGLEPLKPFLNGVNSDHGTGDYGSEPSGYPEAKMMLTQLATVAQQPSSR